METAHIKRCSAEFKNFGDAIAAGGTSALYGAGYNLNRG
jgi:hypothetical protein